MRSLVFILTAFIVVAPAVHALGSVNTSAGSGNESVSQQLRRPSENNQGSNVAPSQMRAQQKVIIAQCKAAATAATTPEARMQAMRGCGDKMEALSASMDANRGFGPRGASR